MSDPGVLGSCSGQPAFGKRMLRRVAAVALAVLACAASIAGAQQAGILEGRLTDIHSRPLEGVQVVLRNVRTGAEFATRTAKGGAYRLTHLVPGSYILEAASSREGVGRTTGILIGAGQVARVQTALALHEGPLDPAPVQARVAPPATARMAPLRTAPPVTPELQASIAPVSSVSSLAALAAPLPSPAASLAAPASVYRLSAGPGALLVELASASLVAAISPTAQVPDALPRPGLDVGMVPVQEDAIGGEELESLPLNAPAGEAFRLDAPPQPETRPDAADAGNFVQLAGDRHPARVDGMSLRLAFGRGSGRRDLGALTGPAAAESAVREVQGIASFGIDPTFLRAEGSMRTRSGADLTRGRLHGQVFLFDRQNLLNARNPSTEWIKETAPATELTLPVFTAIPWSPADRDLRWGGGAGGPILRDRLFWYSAFSHEWRNDPAVATVRHPDRFFASPALAELQLLSARLDLPSADPVGEGLAAYSGMLETLEGLLGPVSRTSTRSTIFARMDWKPASHHHFVLEGSAARWDAPGGGFLRPSEMYGSHSFAASKSREVWATGRWDAIVTGNLALVTQVAAGDYNLQHPPGAPSAFEEKLNVNPWGQLPQMVVDSRYGFSIGNPARYGAGSYPRERLYELRETADWQHGPLSFRAAGEFRHNADRTSFVRNHTGTYHYTRIENFISDALVFAKYGLAGALDPASQHNCDQRGKAWRDGSGRPHGLGYLPCYAWYTQTVGPTDWHLQTNDWTAYAATQYQVRPGLRLSAALRWDRQIIPPPIPLVRNPDLPDAGILPQPGNEWGPSVGLAFGSRESRWPVLTLGYGLFFGRIQNRTLEQALTETGSSAGDLKLFLRPSDDLPLGTGGAPPFPYVLARNPGSSLKPGVSQIAPDFKNAEVHQAAAAIEERLPGRIELTVSAVATLGRRLPITYDANFNPAWNPGTITYDVVDPGGHGPIREAQIAVPFFAAWPGAGSEGGRLTGRYQEITQLVSRANSTYEAAVVRITRHAARGLAFNVRYTYGHAMDWNPNENGLLSGGDVFDPLDFRQEYGPGNLDIRHSAAGYGVWRAPWKVRGVAGSLANGWLLSGIAQYHSGLPYSMRTEGGIPEMYQDGGALVVGLAPGMNGYGGANRVYGVGRNTYRYPSTWKADLRAGKAFSLGHERELQLLGETFNLFNHRNVTEIETTGYTIDTPGIPGALPRLNFLTNPDTGQPEFGLPLNSNATDLYRERQVDFGLRLRFKH